MAFLFSGQTSKCLPRRFPVLFCPCLLVSCPRFPIKSGFPSQMICEKVDAAWSMREWLGRWTCTSKVPSWVPVLRYVHDSPEFKSSATLVNNKLVCLLKVVLFYFFFNHVMSDSTTVLRGTSSSVGYTEDSENPWKFPQGERIIKVLLFIIIFLFFQ